MSDLPFESFGGRDRAERDAALLSEILAESTASDAKGLRLALARILVEQRERRTYKWECECCGSGCFGHVPETTKIARSALGLPDLPESGNRQSP